MFKELVRYGNCFPLDGLYAMLVSLLSSIKKAGRKTLKKLFLVVESIWSYAQSAKSNKILQTVAAVSIPWLIL